MSPSVHVFVFLLVTEGLVVTRSAGSRHGSCPKRCPFVIVPRSVVTVRSRIGSDGNHQVSVQPGSPARCPRRQLGPNEPGACRVRTPRDGRAGLVSTPLPQRRYTGVRRSRLRVGCTKQHGADSSGAAFPSGSTLVTAPRAS